MVPIMILHSLRETITTNVHLFAALLSPQSAHPQAFGPTVHNIIIETKDPQQDFTAIIAFYEGVALRGTSSNRTFIQSICSEMMIGGCEDQIRVYHVLTVCTFLFLLTTTMNQQFPFVRHIFRQLALRS
jgi:hypothetical protein